MTGNETETEQITDLLNSAKNIAVVGLSDSPIRASHGVAAYLQTHGYRIIPVNPEVESVLGERAYPSLSAVPDRIDLVDIFRRSEYVAPIVDEAIRLKLPAIWMQETVVDEQAASKARAQGIVVVMDKCILKEHRIRTR